MIDYITDLYNLDMASDSMFDSPEGSFQLQEITAAINSLNQELKIPFSMYLSGYPYHEIAMTLNLPIGTVKSRIFFARKELKAKLKAYGYE